MSWISTADQCRALDRKAIENWGVSGLALMETASLSVARRIARDFHAQASRGVVVACGLGNNGGDGYVVARWLHLWGYPVTTWALGDPTSPDATAQAQAARAVGVLSTSAPDTPGLWVDALFGTGLTRPVTGEAAEMVRRMNQTGGPIVSVDVPSGLDADSGAELGACVYADLTVSFARYKPGLLCGAGVRAAGTLVVEDIGLPRGPELSVARMYQPGDVGWPVRGPDDHKGTHGHLLVVAGSARMAGAAVLCGLGAMAAGTGRITLLAPRGAAPRLEALPPEIMWHIHGDGDVLADLPDGLLGGADAVVAGPGLGGGAPLPSALAKGLSRWWEESELPMLFDADALVVARKPAGGPRVMTPHPGEAGRLLDVPTASVTAARFDAARKLSHTGAVSVLKGPYSIVSHPEGNLSVNPTNSPLLASGGTGDVLAGLVGGLMARGLSPWDASRLGVWAHGRAAEALQSAGVRDATASDVAYQLRHVASGRDKSLT